MQRWALVQPEYDEETFSKRSSFVHVAGEKGNNHAEAYDAKLNPDDAVKWLAPDLREVKS
jgi:hypothetical protein